MKAAQIIVFMVCISAAGMALSSAGLDEAFGVNQNTGIDGETDELSDEFSTYSTNTDSSGSIFNDFLPDMLLTAINTVMAGIEFVHLLPDLLVNMGLPEWVANFVTAPIYIITGFTVVYMLSSRDITR